MDSIFEVQRQTHEEVERYERALYTLLSRNQPTHEGKLQTEHKASQILDRISSKATTLNTLYQDKDTIKAEADRISSASRPDDLTEFYSRLVKIQEYHAKYPDSTPGGLDLEIAAFLDEPGQEDEEYEEEDPISLLFSGEESYGKYVDLYAHHVAYTNLKNIGKRPGYLQYLDILLAAPNGLIHQNIPKETRLSKDYENYIKDLYSYLVSFVQRTQPLRDLDTQLRTAQEEFDKQWEEGGFAEWREEPKNVANGDGIWCAACQKMYSKQTVYDAHLTSKKHVKAAAKLASGDAPSSESNGKPNGDAAKPHHSSGATQRQRSCAQHTYLTTDLLKTLLPVLEDTKSNVERRFSLTANEREQELLEQQQRKRAPPPPVANGGKKGEDDEEGGEEEEEERIYNPLKLPLGWDGKPIPYWLYKLHGLGVEYRCEICSDQVYYGRKNFDRHFQESRHAFGMRALGLPNTKHFHEITRIEDALSLAEKLKAEGRHEIFEQETMEELEDDEGNVYNRKTYEDLKKQGLI
ncbi:RNA splicing factor PRP9 [Schizophyllum commune]